MAPWKTSVRKHLVVFFSASALCLAVGCGGGSGGGSGGGADGGGGGGSGDGGGGGGDSDGDGFADAVDNCPDVSNNDQLDFDEDGLGDPCDPDPPPETCGEQQVAATALSPNVFIQLDRSLSMDDNDKWDQATAALDEMATNLADDLRFGLAAFTGDGGDNCGPPTRYLSLGDHRPEDIQDSYDSLSPSGYTPMRLALTEPLAEGWLDDPDDPQDDLRSKNLVLITDGEPNCAEGTEGSDQYEVSDLSATLDAATALFEAGIRVHVVGFGSGVDDDALNDLADRGGTDNESDPDNRYYQANSSEELEEALLAIGSSVQSCELVLDGQPADASRIYVVVDGTPIARDDPDGFAYEEGTNTVVLQGAACDALMAASSSELEVIFGCPADGGPPIL